MCSSPTRSTSEATQPLPYVLISDKKQGEIVKETTKVIMHPVLPQLTPTTSTQPVTKCHLEHSSVSNAVLYPESPSFQPPKIVLGPRLILVTHSSHPTALQPRDYDSPPASAA